LAGIRVPDDCKQIAADAVAGRFHQAQSSIGGDGRIDCVAALAHGIQRDLRGQRVAGRRHRVRGHDRRAGGERLAGDAVSRHGFCDRDQLGEHEACAKGYDPAHHYSWKGNIPTLETNGVKASSATLIETLRLPDEPPGKASRISNQPRSRQ
jgi:hypothetical protein